MTTAKHPAIDFNALRAEFPRDKIHWRAQSVTKQQPYRALALAYIDARHVMERLDTVCGPDKWQDSYCETAKGRVLCTLSILVDGEWISKSDGAGTTDVEGDKGAISDALKRAAVKWGIGRYLYGIGSPWVPCEVNQQFKWKKWTKDPWELVRDAPVIPELEDEEPSLPGEPEPREKLEGKHASKTALQAALREYHGKITTAASTREIDALASDYADDLKQARQYLPGWLDGDPSKPDSKGLIAVETERRNLVWLMDGLRANDTVLERDHWFGANEEEIDKLGDVARGEFDKAFEEHDGGLRAVAAVAAG